MYTLLKDGFKILYLFFESIATSLLPHKKRIPKTNSQFIIYYQKGGYVMDKEKIIHYTELFSKKIANLWDEMGDDLKLAKNVTEIRIRMEYLETKQERLFKEYGKKVFIYKECTGAHVDNLLQEIDLIEQELQKKYLQLQKLKAEN